jgi:hypothetical protein
VHQHKPTKSEGYDTDVEMKEITGNQTSASISYRADNQNRGRAIYPPDKRQAGTGQKSYSSERYRPSSNESGKY